MASILSDLAEEIEKVPSYTVFGRVTAVLGMMVEIEELRERWLLETECI